MKKILRNVICLLLTISMVVGLFGCTAKAAPNTASDIEIIYWESGYGRDYMLNLVAKFNEKYPQYKANLVSSAAVNNDTVYLDPDTNTADLYISTFELKNAYKEYLEPMEDLLDVKPDGESGKTIGEKLGVDFKTRNLLSDGHLYFLPWNVASTTGIIYNKNLFKDLNGNPYRMPRTTDELVELCLTIKSDNKTPWVFSSDYWNYIIESWTAQYEGLDVYLKERVGIYTDEFGVEHPNDVRIITENKGRYEAYKVLENLVGPYGYAMANTNNFTFTAAQTYFLAAKAVMMPNGTWVENEMKVSDANIGMMEMPILSAVGTKLGLSDEDLAIVVDYIDGVMLSATDAAFVESLPEETIDFVREARSIHYNHMYADIFIPNYSNAKVAAKEFLKFYYSDEALKITQETLNTFVRLEYSNQPTIDKSMWTPFMREVDEMRKNWNTLQLSLNTPIGYKGGLNIMYHYVPSTYLTYRDQSYNNGQLQVDDFTNKRGLQKGFWKLECEYWQSEWPRMLVDAGLL